MKSLSELSEKTLVPVGIALAVFGGGAVWMTKISFIQDAQGARIEKTESHLDASKEYLQDIRERLIRIEMRLNKK